MRFAIATLHAIAAAVLSGVLLGFAAGHLTPTVAAASLVVGAAIGLLSLWNAGRCAEREPWQIEAWGGAALVVFALFAARSFLWLVFRAGDELWVFSPNNLGDLSLHLTYVRYLANGAPFWPENPIFAGEPLTYPIGMDLFNSLLDFLGIDVLSGFIAVGLLLSACTAAMLWRWGRGFAVAGFLFAGGLFGFQIFTTGKLVDFQAEAAWKSLPLALFVTQRGLLYALPAGLALLASWRARFLEPGRAGQRLPLWSEWLLYATMPVFHLHTFLVLSLVAAWWFCFVKGAQKHLALVVGLAVLPATFLVWCVTGGFHGTSMVSRHLGWMQGDDNFFVFWGLNFGLFLPLAIWLVVLAFRRSEMKAGNVIGVSFAVFFTYGFLKLVGLVGERAKLLVLIGVMALAPLGLFFELFRRRNRDEALACVLPGAVIFLACCIWKFAPWEWDNTKLMLWAYVLVLPAMWQLLFARWPEWGRVVVGVPLFFSGAVSLLGGLTGNLVTGEDRSNTLLPHLGYSLQTKRSEIDGAFWATSDIPITDRFIANPNYNHPLLLAGRLVVMGYEGHIWSHGFDPSERKQTIARILNGSPAWREDARRLGARWLFWGDQEREACPDSTRPWEKECPVHATGAWGTIYDLSQRQ